MSVSKLLDEWMNGTMDSVSLRTWENREGFVRLHIKPNIGTKKLARLTADDVRKLYREKLAQGLAPSSVKRIYVILPPKQHQRGMDVLCPDDVCKLLTASRGTRYEAIIVLGATCGLRVGESLHLR
jgi:integrase